VSIVSPRRILPVTGMAVVFALSVIFVCSTSFLSSAAKAQDTLAAIEVDAPPPADAPTMGSPAGEPNINIFPKRVVLDRGARSAIVYLYNKGTAPGTFNIQLVDRVMLPNGEIVDVAEVGARPELKPYIEKLQSAKPMLVISPRRVTLAAGKTQAIRVRIGPTPNSVAVERSSEAATAVEYRTHLTISSVPSRDIGITAEEVATDSIKDIDVRITTSFGISIPVILRPTAPDVRGRIVNLTLARDRIAIDETNRARYIAVLNFDIERLGLNSLFGHVEARGASDMRDAPPLGVARGVGVYPEIAHRNVSLPLNRIPLSGEKIAIVFKDDGVKPAKIIAAAEYVVP
jgi:Na+-transporting methylmalonyl-CoA/oxaloacetate decarboxylase gamma subunit